MMMVGRRPGAPSGGAHAFITLVSHRPKFLAATAGTSSMTSCTRSSSSSSPITGAPPSDARTVRCCQRRQQQQSCYTTRKSLSSSPTRLFLASAASNSLSPSAASADDALSTSNSQQTTTVKPPPDIVPSYRQLIVFCSTTILIWLSEPLLSLVDTTVVGLTQGSTRSSTVQLAALGPATTLTDSLLYLTYFLAIATTNRIAAERALPRNYRQLQQTTSHVLGVAVVLGLAVTLVAILGARPLLTHMAGASGTPELLQHAVRYTQIRGVASVAAVAGCVLQSFCLAVLDTKTPARAVAAASVTNVVGDLLLAPSWGVRGAAVATAASSVVSAAILGRSVRRQLREWRRAEVEEEDAQGVEDDSSSSAVMATTATMVVDVDEDGASRDETAAMETTRSIRTEEESSTRIPPPSSPTPTAVEIAVEAATTNAEQEASTETSTTNTSSGSSGSNGGTSSTTTSKPIPLLSLPDKKSALQLIGLAGPIFFVILAKVACYGAMTIRCTDFGVEALAAHSIMMRVFFFWGCFGDSLSQTAQSFLPATMYPRPNRPAYYKILRRMLVLTAGLGILDSQASILILKHLGQYLTSDTTIITLMKNHTGFMALSILLHPFIMLLEGTVIASRNFRSLIIIYTATLGLHFGILKLFSGSFPAVWRTFFLFQSTRLALYAYRVVRSSRSTSPSVQQDDDNSSNKTFQLEAPATP